MGNRNIPKVIFKAGTRFTKKNYFHILFCDKNFKLIGRLGSFEMHKTKPFFLNTFFLSKKLIIENLLNVPKIRTRTIFRYFFLNSVYKSFLKKNGIGKLFSKLLITKNNNGFKVF